MFKVVCIDASCRPQEIPISCWLIEGEEYTALRVGVNKITHEEYLILQEVQPTPPYGGFKVSRFKLPHPNAIESQYEVQALETTV